MKQVIQTSESSINVEEVNPRKFYGVDMVGHRGIIQSDKFVNLDFEDRGGFIVKALDGFTNSNCYGYSCTNNTLAEFIKILLDKTLKVYEFNKLSELAKWVEEEP